MDVSLSPELEREFSWHKEPGGSQHDHNETKQIRYRIIMRITAVLSAPSWSFIRQTVARKKGIWLPQKSCSRNRKFKFQAGFCAFCIIILLESGTRVVAVQINSKILTFESQFVPINFRFLKSHLLTSKVIICIAGCNEESRGSGTIFNTYHWWPGSPKL